MEYERKFILFYFYTILNLGHVEAYSFILYTGK